MAGRGVSLEETMFGNNKRLGCVDTVTAKTFLLNEINDGYHLEVHFRHCSVVGKNIRNSRSQTEIPHSLCVALALVAFQTFVQQLQWHQLTAATPDQLWFSCPLHNTIMVFSYCRLEETAPTIIRALSVLHHLTAAHTVCKISKQMSPFFGNEYMSETEPLSTAPKLHFHLLLWSVFLLFRRKLLWILFRGYVSSEVVFPFLPPQWSHLLPYQKVTSYNWNSYWSSPVCFQYGWEESLFLRYKASEGKCLQLCWFACSVHQSGPSLVLSGLRVILFTRGHWVAASYLWTECLVAGGRGAVDRKDMEPESEDSGRSTELKQDTRSPFLIELTSYQITRKPPENRPTANTYFFLKMLFNVFH